MRLNKHIKEWVWIIGLTILLIGGIEVALRVLFFEKLIDRGNQEEVAYMFHPTYLVDLKPNQSKQFTRTQVNGGDTIYWKTNSGGYRESMETVDSEYTLYVFGDSNIQGRFSSYKHTLPGQLGVRLSQTLNLEVNVVNAGVIGFGPDQCLLKMKEKFSEERPDYVILNIFADNDYGDIIRNGLFRIDQKGKLRLIDHQRTPDPYLNGTPVSFWDYWMVARMSRAIGRKISGADLPEHRKRAEINMLTSLCANEYEAYVNEQWNTFSVFKDHYDIDLAIDPHSEASKLKVLLMEEILKEVQRFTEEQQIGLLVLIQPSVQDLTQNQVIGVKELKQFPSYDPSRLSSLIEDMCLRNQINYLNLWEPFKKIHRKNSIFCWMIIGMIRDRHWRLRQLQIILLRNGSNFRYYLISYMNNIIFFTLYLIISVSSFSQSRREILSGMWEGEFEAYTLELIFFDGYLHLTCDGKGEVESISYTYSLIEDTLIVSDILGHFNKYIVDLSQREKLHLLGFDNDPFHFPYLDVVEFRRKW